MALKQTTYCWNTIFCTQIDAFKMHVASNVFRDFCPKCNKHDQYILLFTTCKHYKISNGHSYQYNNTEKLKLFTISGVYLIDHMQRLDSNDKTVINNNNNIWRSINKEENTKNFV